MEPAHHFCPSVSIGSDLAFSLALFVCPIACIIIYSDLKRLKIPNFFIHTSLVGYGIAAAIHLDLSEAASSLLRASSTLFAGYFCYLTGKIGAGDVKLLSVAALIVPIADAPILLILTATNLITGWLAIKFLGSIPAVVNLAPDWRCWQLDPFPLGFPLAFSLAAYVFIGAL